MTPVTPRTSDTSPAQPAAAGGMQHGRTGMDWRRFWIQALVAMMVFNIVAALVTWFFIFPRLHPAH